MALEMYVRETAALVISDLVSTDGGEMELLNIMLEGMPHLERSKAVTMHEKCKKLIKVSWSFTTWIFRIPVYMCTLFAYYTNINTYKHNFMHVKLIFGSYYKTENGEKLLFSVSDKYFNLYQYFLYCIEELLFSDLYFCEIS